MSGARLRIALAKGRLWEPAIARFTRAGMAPVSDRGRRLLLPSEDPAIEFLEIKPGDVPIYVESGAADLGITGTDVLREIRANERTKLLPVVILTSSKEDEDIFRSYALGANAYVRKPVDFGEFAKAAKTLGMFWLLMNEPVPGRQGPE